MAFSKKLVLGAFAVYGILAVRNESQFAVRGHAFNPLLAERMQDIVERGLRSGEAERVSVYYQDLDTGATFQFHASERFAPASLMKAAILLGLFHEEELHPGFLKNEAVFHSNGAGAYLLGQSIVDVPVALSEGRRYSLEQLARRMIAFSDNASTRLLMDSAPAGILKRTLHDLKLPEATDQSGKISPADYAQVFLALQRGTYLGTGNSRLALSLLKTPVFRGGLLRGLPGTVPVAHKYGVLDSPAGHDFHHCGIVYAPARNYVLCVMTEGHNPAGQETLVSKISQGAYYVAGADL